MAVIGFLFILVFLIWVFMVGWGSVWVFIYLSHVKLDLITGFVLMALACIGFYLAITYSPFTLTIN